MKRLNSIFALIAVIAVALAAFAYTQPLDNFNRADGAVGANWTDRITSGAAVVRSNALAVNNVWGYGDVYWTSASQPVNTADEWVQVMVLRLSGTTPSPVLRSNAAVSGARTEYLVQANSAWYKFVAGTSTWLGGSCAVSAGDTFKAQAVGSTLAAYRVNVDPNTAICTITDSTIASGVTGVYLMGDGVAVFSAVDDFSADCIPGCGAAAPAKVVHRVTQAWNQMELVPRAYAETIARVYLMPKVNDGAGNLAPKYLAQLGAGAVGMDFGPEGTYIVAAKVDSATDAALTANADVLALPANLDANLTAGAVTTAKNWLEARNIPAEWVTTSLTYRQVLRTVAQMFQFAQRYEAISGGARLFPQGITLASTVGELDATTKANWQQTATSLGYSFAGITNASTLRQALKTLGQQWGARPIELGGVTL